MNTLSRWVAVCFASALIALFGLTVWSGFQPITYIANWAIIVPIYILLISQRWMALTSAALFGLIGELFSIFPTGTVFVTELLMLVAVIVLLTRVFASRSTISVVVSIITATLISYIIGAAIITLNHNISGTGVTPDWTAWLQRAGIQSIIHPILIILIWRRFGGGRYDTLQTRWREVT